MKKIIFSAVIALLAVPAFAQEHPGHDGHDGAGMRGQQPHAAVPAPHPGGGMAAHRGPQTPANLPAQARERGNRGGGNPMADTLHNAGVTGLTAPGNAAQNRGGRDSNNNAMRDHSHDNNNAMRGGDRSRDDNNAMRGNAMRGGNAMMGNNRAGRSANWNNYHRNFTAPRRYHAPTRYHRPTGWYSHRWVYGERLPSAFFGRDYWIDDFNDFGLIDPPYGAVWVRYGDDALLIDQETGEVIQVEYGVFY